MSYTFDFPPPFPVYISAGALDTDVPIPSFKFQINCIVGDKEIQLAFLKSLFLKSVHKTCEFIKSDFQKFEHDDETDSSTKPCVYNNFVIVNRFVRVRYDRRPSEKTDYGLVL